MEKKVIRVGSVGVGEIWNGVHAPGIAKSPDLALVAICDIDEKKLQAAGEKYGIPPQYRFTDYRDLINCDIVDAVDICTSNDAHFKVAMAAVEAGKPFDLEKPITLTAEEADILAKAAQEKNIKNMVCFSYRFKAAARYAKDLIAQGKIGRVYHVNMQYFQAWGLPRANCPLVWRYVKSRNGQGVGKVDVDDFSNYMADMEEGISVSFQITRFAYGRGNYQRMEIYGSEGAIVYSLDATPAGIDEIEVCSGDINADAHVFNHLPIPQQYFSDQMQSFADIVNGTGDGLAATIQDGQANQHLLDAIVESAEKGSWLSL